ncbi:hypothetical protein RDI58_013407 [Solanum bulbocastanum]|uniref:Uncharacterized protein n=1 Tax=Solanum bulbocastanum TaxID=147425 RepID=A0AAN8TQT9_SOLBU
MLPNTTKGALLSVTSFTRSVVLFQLSTAFPPRLYSKREALASRSLTLDGLSFSLFVVAERIMCRWKSKKCPAMARKKCVFHDQSNIAKSRYLLLIRIGP